MTGRTDERSQDHPGTARLPNPANSDLGELVARLRAVTTLPMLCNQAADAITTLLDALAASNLRAEALEKERDAYKAALTPSADTKGAYIGEIRTIYRGRDEFGDDWSVDYVLPWDTIKDVMALIRRAAELHAAIRGEGK